VVPSADVVLPVASEADCPNCHATALDGADPRLPQRIITASCNGSALAPTQLTDTVFEVATIDTAPGESAEQRRLLAAKRNILRLHDAQHGAAYPAAWGPEDDGCSDGGDADCLANLTPIQRTAWMCRLRSPSSSRSWPPSSVRPRPR
jgi:hypothetical protein